MTRQRPHAWIVHCPAGGGHRAAATALAEHASGVGCTTEVVDALSFTPPWFAKSYVQTHLKSTHYTPWAYGFGYKRLNRRNVALDSMRTRVDGLIGRRLLDAVARAQPDVIIATHFFPLSVLSRARRKGRLHVPLIGVVTDYTAHAIWAERGVDSFCATEPAALDLRGHGIPAAAIHTTGIPIRRAFGQIRPVDTRHLEASPLPNTVRVLATSGGFGIGPLETAMRSFVGLPHLELTVVCGADEKRRARVEAAARRHRVRANVLGFERDMPARMADAHVVLGKPGGLTVSEALAAGRPMALMGICPGQEAQNATWLQARGAAVVVDPAHAGPHLESLRRSGRLAEMSHAALACGTPDAASRVLDVATRALGRSAHHAAA